MCVYGVLKVYMRFMIFPLKKRHKHWKNATEDFKNAIYQQYENPKDEPGQSVLIRVMKKDTSGLIGWSQRWMT